MIKLYYPKFWQSKNILAYILLPLGWVYLFLGAVRKFFAKPIKFNARTICIGNATIGGTGKTQVVIKLAQELAKRNINFIILSKGYGGRNCHYSLVTKTSSPYDVGDEALELCEYGTTFSVPKISYAQEIIAKYKPDIVLVDDGMQNPNFIKDFVIMTIDGSRGFGNGFPIPAGPMRCITDDALKAADAVVVVGRSRDSVSCNVIPVKTGIQKIYRLDSRPRGNDNTFTATIKPTRKLASNKYYAFAGIGNPEKFFATLSTSNANLIKTKIFPDHYNYTKKEIVGLIEEAKFLCAKLITTRKDYVKIRHIFYEDKLDLNVMAAEMVAGPEVRANISELKVDYLEIDLEIEGLQDLVDKVIG